MNRVHLDIQSRSEARLKEIGAVEYARHPSTRILFVTYAFDDGPPACWEAGWEDPFPAELEKALSNGSVAMHFWFGETGLALLRDCLGLRMSGPKSRVVSTCVLSREMGLGSSLFDATIGAREWIGLTREQVDTNNYLARFCLFYPKRNPEARIVYPSFWQRFKNACAHKVEAERRIWQRFQS